MKQLVKLIREKTDGTLAPIDVRKAEVSRDGLRAVDSGIFTVPSRVPATMGNVYKYIQDVADTTHLRGAYLFQGSCLDESGYNVDPTNQTHGTISGFTDYDGLDYAQNTTAGHKFRGLTYGKVNAGEKGVFIQNSSHHNFKNDFDIISWVTVPTSASGFSSIYTKTDGTSTNGAGYGIRVALHRSNSQGKCKAVVYMRSSGNSLESLGTSYKIASGTCCVRVRRVGNTVSLWLVDGSGSVAFGTPDDTETVSGDFSVTKQATIGCCPASFSGDNVVTTGDKFTGGELHSLRIYCGGTLDSKDAENIYAVRPTPLIMKLAGSVWKIEENIDTKRLYVKGFGKVITDTLVNTEIFQHATNAATGEYYNTGSRNDTDFTNATPVEIIRSIFANLNVELSGNSTFKLGLRDISGSGNQINTYTADGNFLEIINQLMMIVNKSFYVSPRGKCLIENKNIDVTNSLKFEHSRGYNINADGFDDTNTVNDLYVATRAGGNFSTVRAEDTTSIAAIGLYAKRLLAPQITDAAAAITFRTNFLATHKDINSRYTIMAPFLLNFVRENFKVTVKNSVKNLNTSSTIKSITWHYPESRTVIETGEHLLDAFDLDAVSSETINNLVTDTALNP